MSTTYARERTLQDEIAPAVEARVPGVEVLAVELLSPSRFCVYVDHPDGVDHALCAHVTRVLDPYRADYTIDVSSPGPERPLRKPEHFAEAVGCARRPCGSKAAGRTDIAACWSRPATTPSRSRPVTPARSASRTTRSCGPI